MPGDGDMLHLLEILRLRQTRVELALKKERHESFSQNEYKELVLEAREVMKSWQEKNLPLMQQFGMG